MVGDDPASAVYESEIIECIEELNADPAIDGILCQLPVPDHISPSLIASAVLPDKDVDGFHPVNVGRLWRGEDGLFPCTAVGIIALLEERGKRY